MALYRLQPGKSLYSVQPRVWLSSGRGDLQKRSHGIAVSLGQPQSSTEDIVGCISLKLEIQSAQTTEWPRFLKWQVCYLSRNNSGDSILQEKWLS